ncbi:PA2169 family four-helix-bundle protein [Thalassococcus sp. CAU 1522]|uniref:PA2169 family four-helix-bundle protein n=1 Tax=Thalassococcus arenae TaxID=2851652 RepID=A0ABS6N2Z0_9RHOB|nr:DUF2383 domain-containing protein [Thalassococcus arenae]MBV2358392.1 PA2169 family four-helix-bundle protein [Thalassococcus arenae]
MNVAFATEGTLETAKGLLDRLLVRIIDTGNGVRMLVDGADGDFAPAARKFHDLHDDHADRLRRLMSEAGLDPTRQGSFMTALNWSVVAARALPSGTDDDAMPRLRESEKHVLAAFDDAIGAVEHPSVRKGLRAMRDELVSLLDRTAKV